jgi:hypothetical protein
LGYSVRIVENAFVVCECKAVYRVLTLQRCLWTIFSETVFIGIGRLTMGVIMSSFHKTHLRCGAMKTATATGGGTKQMYNLLVVA